MNPTPPTLVDGHRVEAAEISRFNPVRQTVAAIWRRALGVGSIDVHDDFFLDLGGNSSTAAEVLTQTSAVFDRKLSLSAFRDASTITRLSAYLLEQGWHPPARGGLAVNRDGPRPPLFGVCGAFGHALRLLVLGQALGPEQPFHGLQPPDMDWESAGCRTIEEMAAHYGEEIRHHQPQGPYRLIGTSLGGVLAFEIAVQLQDAGDHVALLAMVDTIPPGFMGPDGIDRAARHDWVAGIDTSDSLVAMGVRVAQAHRTALDRYLLQRTFDGPITYFRCQDPFVPAASDRRLRWDSFAAGGVDVIPVPGRHGRFHREPQFSAVVRGLRVRLESILPHRHEDRGRPART